MARPATGSVVEYEGVRGRTFSIRSRVNGERVFETLGVAPEWDRKRAEQALADRLAAVRLGIWKPLRPDADQAVPTSRTLHVFASEWFDRRRQEVGERTTEHWKWALSNHVLPVLGLAQDPRHCLRTRRSVRLLCSESLLEGELT